MYTATTRAIRVTVKPQYLPDQSDPAKSQFVWAYHVRIENKGDVAVQLRSRHWKITDGLGRVQEVRAPGVVGETAAAETGRDLRVHFRHAALDAIRLHGRHLPDGERDAARISTSRSRHSRSTARRRRDS